MNRFSDRPSDLRLPHGRLLVGLIVVLVSLAATATASANTVYVSPTGTDTNTCGATQSTPCQTIGQGVINASPGDTVSVAPGTYTFSHDVTVNKPLTLAGAQYGVDARTRQLPASPSTESIITGTSTSDAFLDIASNGVVIDGFTIQNNTAGPGLYAAASSADYEIRNDIVDGNVFGIYANSAPSTGGGGSVISHNLITNNNAAGAASGNGIYADGGTQDLTVTANAFSDDTNGSAVFVAGRNQRNIRVTDNSFTNEDPVNFYGVNDSSIANNTFTPGGGDSNPLYAAAVDGGHNISINGNTVDGLLEAAFKVFNVPSGFGADEISSGVQIVGNTITNTGAHPRPNHAGGAIQVVYDGTTALHPYAGTLQVHDNRFAGNAAAIVNQDPSVPIDASDNFWGCNAGANHAGCDSTSGSGITTSPYLLLTLTADQPQLVAGGEATGVHPSLARDSAGATSAGPFPSVPVLLAATLGTLLPENPLLDPFSGIGSSRLTSSDTAGVAMITAKLNNATATTSLHIVSDAGPAGSPGSLGPPGPPGGNTPDVATLAGHGTVKHGQVRLPVHCNGAAGQLCIGSLTLTVRHRRLIATYAIPVGRTSTVTIRLSKALARYVASLKNGTTVPFTLSTAEISGSFARTSGRATL